MWVLLKNKQSFYDLLTLENWFNHNKDDSVLLGHTTQQVWISVSHIIRHECQYDYVEWQAKQAQSFEQVVRYNKKTTRLLSKKG